MSMTRFKATVLGFLLLAPAACWADDAYWVDVRTPDEYASGHVAQAVNIPYETIGENIGQLTTDKDARIYLYCRSGRRSGIALDTLKGAGYRNVENLGGLEQAEHRAAESKQP